MVKRPLVVAHRGASAVAPENTIAAFARAAELGADGVELDVHITHDGELVVHHDAEADGLGRLLDRAFAEIRLARPDIPTLAEVFAVTGAMLVNVEIKCCAWDSDPDPDGRVAAAVVELVRELGNGGQVIVSSFDLAHIDAVRSLDANLETAFLIHGHSPATMVPICVDRGHNWLHPDWGNLDRELDASIAVAHEAGVRLDSWTIDDPEVLRRFAHAGVDALITNDVTTALAALS